MPISNHTDLINYLIAKYKFESYCEIGVQSTRQNFDKIKCRYKVGVDPEVKANGIYKMDSDSFFKQNKETFSLFFIDGYHSADQVQRDFENSLKCLNEGGRIVIHDCLPEDESTTHVPRDSKCWHGNVYSFVMKLKGYKDIDFVTYNFDNGCTVVWESIGKTASKVPENITWELYQKRRYEFMNIQENLVS